MGMKKFSVKLSSIAKEIDKATKKLKAIRSKVSPKERKRLALDIKHLNVARASVAKGCPGKRMTATFAGSGG
jgi:hypothetical protein